MHRMRALKRKQHMRFLHAPHLEYKLNSLISARTLSVCSCPLYQHTSARHQTPGEFQCQADGGDEGAAICSLRQARLCVKMWRARTLV